MNFHSPYPRIAHDLYPTIDLVAVRTLEEALNLYGMTLDGMSCWDPAAGRGDLMRGLEQFGAQVFGTDLIAHEGADPRVIGGLDLFSFGPVQSRFQLISSNLPYEPSATCTKMTKHLLAIAPHCWAAFLFPHSWLAGMTRRQLVSERLHAFVEMKRRLMFFEADGNGEHKDRPEKDHMWALFHPEGFSTARAEYVSTEPESFEGMKWQLKLRKRNPPGGKS